MSLCSWGIQTDRLPCSMAGREQDVEIGTCQFEGNAVDSGCIDLRALGRFGSQPARLHIEGFE